MLQPQNHQPQTLEQTIFTMRILTIAMGMSVAILGFLLFMTKKWNMDQPTFNTLIQNPQVMVLVGGGILCLVLRIPIANSIFRNALQGINNHEDMKSILIAYFTPHILRLALAETAAMFGFIIAFLHGESTAFLILGLSAIIAILREFPNLERIKQMARILKPQRRG